MLSFMFDSTVVLLEFGLNNLWHLLYMPSARMHSVYILTRMAWREASRACVLLDKTCRSMPLDKYLLLASGYDLNFFLAQVKL